MNVPTHPSHAHTSHAHTSPAPLSQAHSHPAALEASRARAALSPGRITLGLRRLERWVAWSIAACTAWVAFLAWPESPVVWLFAAYAALIGQWARMHPSRRQADMFVRALALAGGAWMLDSQAGTGIAASGLMLFWLAGVSLYYAFMLRPLWALALIGFTVVEFLACAAGGAGGLHAQALAQAGALAIFPALASMRFGSAMRRSEERAEHERMDPATGLLNLRGLADHGDECVEACLAERRPASLAVFECADLPELRTVYGRHVSRAVVRRIVQNLQAIAGERGLAARTSATGFAVLLPGLGRERAIQAVQRVLGSPSRIELDVGDCEVVLVPDFMVEAVGASETVGELHDELFGDLARVRADNARHQDYLRRERESHSHPAPLAPRGGSMPTTMAMPLTAL